MGVAEETSLHRFIQFQIRGHGIGRETGEKGLCLANFWPIVGEYLENKASEDESNQESDQLTEYVGVDVLEV